MDVLSEHQSGCMQRLLSQSYSSDPYRQSTLLIGPSGSGKRTVARAAAQALSLDFLEVRLDAPLEQVAIQLFGNRDQADRAPNTGEAPGDAGVSKPTLLYLSGLEGISNDLLSRIHRLVIRRAYIDAAGYEWRLSNDVWLVAALVFPATMIGLHQDHWVCAAFSLHMHIESPSAPDDLVDIARSMCQRYNLLLGDDAIPVVKGVAGASDRLHALRRWLETVALDPRTGDTIVGQQLRGAMVKDPRWLVRDILFRGCRLSTHMLEVWVNQFPEDLRPVALHLVEEIGERYFIRSSRFHSALSDIIENSGIPAGASVVFGRWQDMGDSAPRVAHAIKNQAEWKVKPELDLANLESESSYRRMPPWLVLADDFVGSGDTVCKLFNERNSAGRVLLDRYPNLNIRILIIAGFESGLRNIQSTLGEYGGRVQLVPGILLTEDDTCFAPSSRVVIDPTVREKLRAFCIKAAKLQMRKLSRDKQLGYKGLGALVVYDDSIPNNSLPVLWHNSGLWRALFPRTGMHRLGGP